ncbi:hypothetical protein GCM10009430_39200 [Aquimarina litoralis]|uniref:Lipocalin-like domain-containing protein n=1 Tax=Aquimarina litoralis TaxID=584605 RepID=A0ABN1J5C6_9FLAO
MKTLTKILSIYLFVLLCSCSSDDDEEIIPFSPEQLQGVWRISLYQNQVRNISYDGIDILLEFDGESAALRAFNEEATTLGSYEVDPFEIDSERVWQLQIGLDITDDAHEVLENIRGNWTVKQVFLDASKIEFEKALNPQFDLEVLHLERITNINE